MSYSEPAVPTNALALSRLLIAERPSLVRRVARIVGSGSVAEDVAQMLYLRVQRVGDDPPIVDKRSFLFRLAANLAFDHLRAARRHDAVFADGVDAAHIPSGEAGAEARLLDREKVRRIAAVVETMPLRCRQVFVLVRLDGQSVAETAIRLGISQDMVRKHIRHALRICHRAVADDTAA